jgi:glycosyltransferase involved in cell wall biosynthesis
MALLGRLLTIDDVQVFLTEGMATAYSSVYRARATAVVISNYSFMDTDAQHRQAMGSTAVLGHLSNLSEAKGLKVVVSAFRDLRRNGVPCKLLLAGPPADSFARSMLAELAEDPDVEYVGAVPPAEVATFMSRLDLFLFPSIYRNEAEPLVVLEAVGAGVPVVAYDVGFVKEAVGRGGWCVGVDSPFESAVEEALTSIRRESHDDSRSHLDLVEEWRRREDVGEHARKRFLELVSIGEGMPS